MYIDSTDVTVIANPSQVPNYNAKNPILEVTSIIEKCHLSADLEHYDRKSLDYLIQYSSLELYGPAGLDSGVIDPTKQDNKNDFQKQNIKNFKIGNTILIRGWVVAGDYIFPFLKVSYTGGPYSILGRKAKAPLGSSIRLWLKVNNIETQSHLVVPYDRRTDRYEIELWGFSGRDIKPFLGVKGLEGFANGHIILAPDLIKGQLSDFKREFIDNLDVTKIAKDSLMHPIRCLDIELAWSDRSSKVWDSKEGKNYKFSFNMLLRGWKSFLKAGVSKNPHGGIGFLEYRNLFSNYFEYVNTGELGRSLSTWNLDSNGVKGTSKTEKFMAVDYMDLHILKPSCGIGIHRHRDNQEAFLMLNGSGLMIMGDWAHIDGRERCFEARTMQQGDLTLCKTGQLHGLLNLTDTDIQLFMFGGYD